MENEIEESKIRVGDEYYLDPHGIDAMHYEKGHKVSIVQQDTSPVIIHGSVYVYSELFGAPRLVYVKSLRKQFPA